MSALFDLDGAQDMDLCNGDIGIGDPWRPTFRAKPGSRVHCTPGNYVQELVGDSKAVSGIYVSAVFLNFVKTAVKDAPTHIDENGKIYVRLPWDPKDMVGDGDYVVFMLDATEQCQYYHTKVPYSSVSRRTQRGEGRRRR